MAMSLCPAMEWFTRGYTVWHHPKVTVPHSWKLGSSHSASCLLSSSARSFALIQARWKLAGLASTSFIKDGDRGLQSLSSHPLLGQCFFIVWGGYEKRLGCWYQKINVSQLSYSNCALGNQFLVEIPIRTMRCAGH